eukprot:CAMPEP_0171323652 /NCGR_PEP_ID=MMETSP0816-20121228/115708_1 /TAXON_ID=420281 /ORGANISM="Proboscia inermis, Strain CCAP1064/1" /LENGTH=136 /DNA_ID=CAMNT_0011822409 /DNA_START=61 /DNA_END=471 /DNA_ORIENTATION=-
MSFFLTPGTAAFATLANTLAAKIFMSAAVRSKQTGMNKETGKKFLGEPWVKNACAAQLNEAEYSPLFFSVLMYAKMDSNLNSSSSVGVASTLCVAGSVLYFWGRVFTGKPLPFSLIGGSMRYAGLLYLTYAIYGTL